LLEKTIIATAEDFCEDINGHECETNSVAHSS
jgi:hypothetical protein